MPQVTIYLPEDVLRSVKREAKRRKQSLSAFLAALASRAAKPPAWPEDFAALYGSCPDLVEPEDAAPADVESL
ncbi:ribbon-helix-helix protein, CopG family [bacterium CPR1]|nr:ribbon-helix-helix protein, CopG family [bacterium CPR1]